LVLGLFAALILAGGLIVLGSSAIGKQASPTPLSTNPGSSTQVPPPPGGGFAKGNAASKVTLIEYADFQCPFCGMVARLVQPQIDKLYIQTGKILYVYRNFAFLGPESFWAAEASECANDQGRVWEYIDKVYTNQRGENQGAFSKENLKRFAQELGLDMTAFRQCLDSGKYSQKVRNDSAFAQARGITGTPTFILNGKIADVMAADPAVIIRNLSALIDAELAK